MWRPRFDSFERCGHLGDPMLTDKELLTKVRKEVSTPLAAEVERDAAEAAWLGQPAPLSIETPPKPLA